MVYFSVQAKTEAILAEEKSSEESECDVTIESICQDVPTQAAPFRGAAKEGESCGTGQEERTQITCFIKLSVYLMFM